MATNTQTNDSAASTKAAASFKTRSDAIDHNLKHADSNRVTVVRDVNELKTRSYHAYHSLMNYAELEIEPLGFAHTTRCEKTCQSSLLYISEIDYTISIPECTLERIMDVYKQDWPVQLIRIAKNALQNYNRAKAFEGSFNPYGNGQTLDINFDAMLKIMDNITIEPEGIKPEEMKSATPKTELVSTDSLDQTIVKTRNPKRSNIKSQSNSKSETKQSIFGKPIASKCNETASADSSTNNNDNNDKTDNNNDSGTNNDNNMNSSNSKNKNGDNNKNNISQKSSKKPENTINHNKVIGDSAWYKLMSTNKFFLLITDECYDNYCNIDIYKDDTNLLLETLGDEDTDVNIKEDIQFCAYCKLHNHVIADCPKLKEKERKRSAMGTIQNNKPNKDNSGTKSNILNDPTIERNEINRNRIDGNKNKMIDVNETLRKIAMRIVRNNNIQTYTDVVGYILENENKVKLRTSLRFITILKAYTMQDVLGEFLLNAYMFGGSIALYWILTIYDLAPSGSSAIGVAQKIKDRIKPEHMTSLVKIARNTNDLTLNSWVRDLTAEGIESNPGPVILEKLCEKIIKYIREKKPIESIITKTLFTLGISTNAVVQDIFTTYFMKFFHKGDFTKYNLYGVRDNILDCFSGLTYEFIAPDGTNVDATPFRYRIQTNFGQRTGGAGMKLVDSVISEAFKLSINSYQKVLSAFRTNSPVYNGDIQYAIWYQSQSSAPEITTNETKTVGNLSHIIFNIWQYGMMFNPNCFYSPIFTRVEGMYTRNQTQGGIGPQNIWPAIPNPVDRTWTGWAMTQKEFIDWQMGLVELLPAVANSQLAFCFITADMLQPENELAFYVWALSAGQPGAVVIVDLGDSIMRAQYNNEVQRFGVDLLKRNCFTTWNSTLPNHIVFVRSDLGNTVNGTPINYDINWRGNIINSQINSPVNGIPFNLRQLSVPGGMDSTVEVATLLAQASTDYPFMTAERWFITMYGCEKDMQAAKVMLAITNTMFFPVPAYPMTDEIPLTNLIIPDSISNGDVTTQFGINAKLPLSTANLNVVLGPLNGNGENASAKDCFGQQMEQPSGDATLGFIGDKTNSHYLLSLMSPINQFALATGVRSYPEGTTLSLKDNVPYNSIDRFFGTIELATAICGLKDLMLSGIGMSEHTLVGHMLGTGRTANNYGNVIKKVFDKVMKMLGLEGWFEMVPLTLSVYQFNGRGKVQMYTYDYSFAGTEFYENVADKQNRSELEVDTTKSIQIMWVVGLPYATWATLKKPMSTQRDWVRFYVDTRMVTIYLRPYAGNIQPASGTIGCLSTKSQQAVFCSQNYLFACSSRWVTAMTYWGQNKWDSDLNGTNFTQVYFYIPDTTYGILSDEVLNQDVYLTFNSGSEQWITNDNHNGYVMFKAGSYSRTNMNFLDVIAAPQRLVSFLSDDPAQTSKPGDEVKNT